MTANKRIFLNIIATYGRSLYALVIGLFCGRWTLMALGQTDYGLFGVVGGLTIFVSFLNTLLASAVGRFYAVSVGASHIAGNEKNGLEDCRRWFNTAFALHVVVATVLLVVGYPIGAWAIRSFLTVPVDRVGECIWVWRYTCLSCYVGMVTVPFSAMYTAKQEIAELTIYSVISSTAVVCVLYYMVTHPAVWLSKYALSMCLTGLFPQVFMLLRAVFKYEECKFVRGYLWSADRMLRIGGYALARFWTSFTSMLANQGKTVLVNKYLGPVANASMGVGSNVASQAETLASSVSGAFWPVIANKAGEGDEAAVRRLCFKTCKLSTLMMLIFAVPLMLEAKEVLVLWLVNPPVLAAEICIAIMIQSLLERITEGYWMSVMALGRGVARYSWTIGWVGFLSFILAWVFLFLGFGLMGVCYALVIAKILSVVTRLYLGWRLVELSFRDWLRMVFLPIALTVAITLLVGMLVLLAFNPSFLRVVTTTAVCEIVFIPSVWFFILNSEERAFCRQKFERMFLFLCIKKGKE